MSSQSPKPAALVSAVLPDGSIVETLASADGRSIQLAWIRGEAIEIAETLDLPHVGPVRPYPVDNSLVAHGVVRFPSELGSYESDALLLRAVQAFIHRYADLSDAFEEAAAHYVLLSWVYDAFNELPYLRLKGDFGSGKTRCMQTIGVLCYKPMFASGASTVSPLFRIIDSFRGTLVLDESDFRFSDERAEIVKILNNGNARGFPVLRSESTPTKEFNPKAFDVFGPKIIATRRSFDDRALESRCISEDMTGAPPRPDIPVSLPKTFEAEGLLLRNQLLAYRARWRTRIDSSQPNQDPSLEARVAQIFTPLLMVAVDSGARDRLYALARSASGALKVDRGTSTEALLLDIISELRREDAPLAVKDIAGRFSARFGADSRSAVTPRWVGFQLRSRLSLHAAKSNGVYVIARTEHTKLQALCIRYGVSTAGWPAVAASDVPDVPMSPLADHGSVRGAHIPTSSPPEEGLIGFKNFDK